ncbi:MAG: hypothetical protein QXF12_07990 [Candidatus Aenigmatarchaeota archaeon]
MFSFSKLKKFISSILRKNTNHHDIDKTSIDYKSIDLYITLDLLYDLDYLLSNLHSLYSLNQTKEILNQTKEYLNHDIEILNHDLEFLSYINYINIYNNKYKYIYNITKDKNSNIKNLMDTYIHLSGVLVKYTALDLSLEKIYDDKDKTILDDTYISLSSYLGNIESSLTKTRRTISYIKSNKNKYQTKKVNINSYLDIVEVTRTLKNLFKLLKET